MEESERPGMAIKAIKGVKKVRRSPVKRVVEADIINILKMYHVDKMTQKDIAARFGISRQHCNHIIQEHTTPPSDKGVMISYDPVNVIARSSMTNFERAKSITEDSMQACEISINLIKHELTYLQAALTKGSLKQQGIDTEKFIEKLTKFFQVTAPYCIERKDGKKVDDATPDSQLHKLMNKSIPLRKTS